MIMTRFDSGLQVIKTTKGFNLILKVSSAKELAILEEMPQGYTKSIWEALRTTHLRTAQSWLMNEENGYGLIIYEGQYYDFDESEKSCKIKNWPPEVRQAFYWLKETLPQHIGG